MPEKKSVNKTDSKKIAEMRKVVLQAISNSEKKEEKKSMIKPEVVFDQVSQKVKIVGAPEFSPSAKATEGKQATGNKKAAKGKKEKKEVSTKRNRSDKDSAKKKVLKSDNVRIIKPIKKIQKNKTMVMKKTSSTTKKIEDEKKGIVSLPNITTRVGAEKTATSSKSKVLKTKQVQKKSKVGSKEVVGKKKHGNKKMFLLFVLLLVSVFAVLFFIPKQESPMTLHLSKYIAFPAMIIDDEYISFAKFIDETNKVQLYLDRQKTRGVINELPSRNEVKDNIKKYFIRQKVMDTLSVKYKVSVTQTDINNEMDRLKSQLRSGETIDKVLFDVYGWSLADFESKIIKPYVLGDKLSRIIFSEISDPQELSEKWEQMIEDSKKQMNIYLFIK